MPVIKCETYIEAPISICFDIAGTAEIHAGKSLLTVQKPIGSIAGVPMEIGDYITWQVSHFGMTQKLTSKIIRMEKPHVFIDEMVNGTFQSFTHTHEFKELGEKTIMGDTFTYEVPFGNLGKIADQLLLKKYMKKYISIQAEKVKNAAEKAAK